MRKKFSPPKRVVVVLVAMALIAGVSGTLAFVDTRPLRSGLMNGR